MKTSYQIAVQLQEQWVAAGNPAGRCQCCGATIHNGVQGCFEVFGDIMARGYTDPVYGAATDYCVDAHALQHPEIHGKKNNAAHILRLCWMLEHEGATRGSTIPRWWQQYLAREQVPLLDPPVQRGALTVTDLQHAVNAAEHLQLARRWAEAVWAAWSPHHAWVRTELRRLNVR
jgi:hypothetical protein